MKKIILLLSLIASTSFAQTFRWSETTSTVENEADYKIDNYFYGRLFKLKTKYNQDTFNKDVIVDIVDPKDDFESEVVNASLDQPAMGLTMKTLIDLFQLSEKNFVYFVTEFDRSTKMNELFWMTANIDTGTKTKHKFITSFPGKNGVNPGDYYVAQSPNKEFYVALKVPSYDKKVNQKITFTLIDKTFKVVKEKEYEFPFSSKQSGNQQLYVSNEGVVFMIKEIDLPKVKAYKSVYVWNPTTDAVVEETLKLENDLQIHQLKGQFYANDFYINGLYTDKNSRDFQFNVSYSGSDGVNSLGVFCAKYDGKGVKKYITLNSTGKINDLNIKDFVVSGDKTWALMDHMFVVSKRRPLAQTNMKIINDNTYSNDGIEVGLIDNATGKLEWLHSTKIGNPSTVNDNGDLLSFMYTITNEGVALIYNQHKSIYESKLPILQNYTKTGKLVSTTPLNNSLPAKYSLDNSTFVKVENNKYMVRCKIGSSAKYGYLTF
jgi:hypothetical protein